MTNALKGLGVAMITPFKSDGKIDYPALERLVKHLHTGVDYLVVMGTTGEAATLSASEQLAVLDAVIEYNAQKLPIVYGIGGNNTAEVCKAMAGFDREGVTAFLSASPAYSKPTQEGIYRHYLALSEASKLPIILYNVPGRTASNVLPATVDRIARATKNVLGIKEAAGNMEQVLELSRILPASFLLLSGDDALALPHMVCGGHGIISVIGNAYPKLFGDAVRAALSRDFKMAREKHLSLLPMIGYIFAEGNPGGVKEVLKFMGICGNDMRLPLYPVSAGLSEKIGVEMGVLV